MKTYTIYDKTGKNWIEIMRTARGEYAVVGNSVTEGGGSFYDRVDLVFEEWDGNVLDLCDNGDLSYFYKSNHLCFEAVDLTASWIEAPSVKKIKEALMFIKLGSFCMSDV